MKPILPPRMIPTLITPLFKDSLENTVVWVGLWRTVTCFCAPCINTLLTYLPTYVNNLFKRIDNCSFNPLMNSDHFCGVFVENINQSFMSSYRYSGSLCMRLHYGKIDKGYRLLSTSPSALFDQNVTLRPQTASILCALHCSSPMTGIYAWTPL